MERQPKRRRRVKYEARARSQPPPDDLTVAEAATYLGRSTEQVRRYLREGALAGYRTGGQWLVPAEAATEFRQIHVESVTMKERQEVLSELRELRAKLLRKYGYLDVSGWVAEAREGLR